VNEAVPVATDGLLTTAELAARPDFRLGLATISPLSRTIAGPGGTADVEPRVMQVLVVLADAAGAIVTRDNLFQRCWGGVYVSDDSLNRAISGVRKLATEIGRDSFVIETVRQTGYRLVVAEEENIEAAAASDALHSRRFILAGGAGVAAAAAAAGAAWLWSRPRHDPEFDAAMDRGLTALRYGDSAADFKAVQEFRRATSVRPSAASGWGLLAFALVSASQSAPGTRSGDLVQQAERAARGALRLDPRDPDARTAVVLIERSMNGRAAVEDGLRQALAGAPDNPRAIAMLDRLLQGAGRAREAWALNERAIAIEPMAPSYMMRRALKLWVFGRSEEAQRASQSTMDLWPTHPLVRNARLMICAFTGRTGEALALIEEEAARPVLLSAAGVAMWRKSIAALESRTPSLIDDARQANLEGARASPPLAAHALLLMSALDDIDAAFEIANGFLLARGPIVLERKPHYRSLWSEAAWRNTLGLFTPPTRPMRLDRRFSALSDGLGLTEYWRERGKPDAFFF